MDLWASSPLKYGPAKIERKRVKKPIFIDIMHGIEVEDDAKMNYNQTSKHILLFVLDPLTLTLSLSLYFVSCIISH